MTGDQVLLILAIGSFASIVKSTAGFGYPLLMLPILSQIISVVDAVLLIAPSNLFLNLGIIFKLREHAKDATTLRVFNITGLLGAAVGTLVLPTIPTRTFQILLFAILVAFLINRMSGLDFKMTDRSAHRFAPVVGLTAGIFQGASGASGPIVTPWFLSVNMKRDTFIFSIASFFAISQVGQIVVAGISELYTPVTIFVGLALIPIGVVALPLGALIRERISVVAFERGVIGLLTLSATALLIRIL